MYEDTILALDHLPKQFATGIVILGCWNIWIQRNGKIFRNEVPSVNCWKFKLKQDLELLKDIIKAKYLGALQDWFSAHL